jgi:cytochrome c oxidase cbb3-type subunit 3
MKNILYKISALAFSFLILGSSTASAQAAADSGMSPATTLYILAGFVAFTAILVLYVSVVILRLLRFIVREEAAKQAGLAGEPVVEEESWWSKFVDKANDVVPIEEEETIMLDHNYDGIRELDNHLPPWWKWTFYLSIVFAVVYMVSYHVIGNMPLQIDEYNKEVAIAQEAALQRAANAPLANIDESNVEMATDPADLAKGKQVFMNSCAQCHKEQGEGGIGPNLTDDYWLHGGSISEVFVTIKNGVPEKGMISWEPVLSPTQMQNVASYIMTLRGTNPPNAKAPQGELYTPESENVEEEVQPADSLQLSQVN